MAFIQNKKGMELQTIAAIILLVISTFAIAGIYKTAASKVDQKSVEVTCKSFNAIRFGVEKGLENQGFFAKIFGRQFNAPRVCSTIAKQGTVPTKDYQDAKGGQTSGPSNPIGAANEIRDMMSRCYWMWLEGKQQNVFSRGIFDLKDGCFVCYTFNLQKNVKVTYPQIINSLQESYPQSDIGDRCPSGKEPNCKDSCESSIEREANSLACKKKCCVKKFTYLDYLQGTNGAPSGKGFLLIDSREKDFPLSIEDTYAVAFVSPKSTWSFESATQEIGAIGTGVAGVLIVVSAPLSLPAWGVGVSLAIISEAASQDAYLKEKDKSKYNHILLSKYQNIQNNCYVEKSYV